MVSKICEKLDSVWFVFDCSEISLCCCCCLGETGHEATRWVDVLPAFSLWAAKIMKPIFFPIIGNRKMKPKKKKRQVRFCSVASFKCIFKLAVEKKKKKAFISISTLQIQINVACFFWGVAWNENWFLLKIPFISCLATVKRGMISKCIYISLPGVSVWNTSFRRNTQLRGRLGVWGSSFNKPCEVLALGKVVRRLDAAVDPTSRAAIVKSMKERELHHLQHLFLITVSMSSKHMAL